MTESEAAARPSASEALARFNAVAAQLGGAEARWRLWPMGESARARIFHECVDHAREGLYRMRAGGRAVLTPLDHALPNGR